MVASLNGQASSTSLRSQPGASQSSGSSEVIKRRRSPSTSSSIIDVTDEVLASSSGRPLKASRRLREHEATSSNFADHHKTDLVVPSTLPVAPPKSPTPVKFAEGKYRFTPEDEAFFVNLVLWHAKTDTGASRNSILLDLTTRVSHCYNTSKLALTCVYRHLIIRLIHGRIFGVLIGRTISWSGACAWPGSTSPLMR